MEKKAAAFLLILISSLVVTKLSTPAKSQKTFSETPFFPTHPWRNEALLINASDYVGANDTERLQAALNDVPPEGATILISGLWTASGLTAKSNTTILGANGTIQRPYNTTNPFITFSNASNFMLANLTFNGRDIPDGYGVNAVDTTSFNIQNNTFLNFRKSAVKVSISSDGISENFTIAGNTFLNCNDAPIIIFGSPSKRAIRQFSIMGNTLMNGSQNGKIAVAFSSTGLIENNTIVNCQHGIATRCVSNLAIRRNLVSYPSDYGVYLGTQIGDNGTDNVTVEYNTIVGAYIGIARWYGSYPLTDVVVRSNVFLNSSLYDIFADFPATYINNTITSVEHLIIQDVRSVFVETHDVENNRIMPGDVNSDFKIDIKDIGSVARKYGCVEDAPEWNPKLDVIKNGIIDIKDIVYVSANFGAAF